MTDPYAPDVGELRQTASEWHGGQSSALYAFVSSGVIADPDRLAAEATRCMAEVEAEPGRYADSDAELDRLYDLVTYAETHRPHYHLWSNVGDYPEDGTPICFTDAAEALDAYLDLVRGYADDEDHGARTYLAATMRAEEYPCGCGHHDTAHSETQPLPCEHEGCGCEGYQPDFGDDEPAMRATVEAILADKAPELGRPYSMVVLDAENWHSEFRLDVVAEADCNIQATQQ